MKNLKLGKAVAFAAILTSIMFVSCDEQKPKTDIALETNLQKATYIIGFNTGKQAKSSGVVLDPAIIAMAIQDVIDEKESRIADADVQTVMQEFQEKIMAKQEEEKEKLKETNLAEGTAYLEENAKKGGVKVTESGLQYKVINAASADALSPAATDRVKVHYHGTLIDGTVFDSSVERGDPATFNVNQVIPGWIEALQLMKVGEKFELTIPSDIAYGPNGSNGIAPNAVLIFEVELLEINP